MGLSWAMFGAEREHSSGNINLYEKNNDFSKVFTSLTKSKTPNLSNFVGILGLMRAILGYLAPSRGASSAVLGVVWFGLVWFGWFGRFGWEVQ